MGSPSNSSRRNSIWAATRNLVTTSTDKPIASTRQLKKASKARISAAWLAQQGELGLTEDPSDGIDKDADEQSRSASLTSDTTNPRGSSTLLTSSLSGSRLSLVTESTKSKSFGPQAKASIDGLAASNSTSSSQDQDDAEAAVDSPIRRRSIFTPGIATRGKSRNTLRKPPPPEHTSSQIGKGHHYDQYFPEVSPIPPSFELEPLARQGSIESRTAMSSELTYSHLAGLRQGTLRITNGAASPVPSVRTERTQQLALKAEKDEEYITASEGRSSEENNGESLRMGVGQAGSRSLPSSETVQTIQPISSRITPLEGETPRCDRASPLKLETPTHHLTSSDIDDENLHTSSKTLLKRRSLSLFEFPPWASDRASSIAEGYIQELPHRSFSRRDPTNPLGGEDESNPPTKRRSLDDEGVAVSPHRECHANEPNGSIDTATRPDAGSREEALSILEGITKHPPEPEVRPLMSPQPNWSASSNVADSEVTDKHSSKADSGYSSKESLNSMQNGSHAGYEPYTEKALPKVPHSTINATGKQPTMPQRLAPAVPLQSLVHANVVRPGRASNFSASPNSSKSYAGLMTEGASEPMTTMAVKEVSRSRSPRKLQKPRRLSQTMLESTTITVQTCKDIEPSQIPVVPSTVAAKYAERMLNFPTLGHTFPSLDHTSSEDDLSATDIVSDPIRFPSPNNADIDGDDMRVGRPRQQSDRASMQQLQSSKEVSQKKSFTARSNGRRRSASRRRSESQTTPIPSISDFGTVAESLGPSPYDVAASTFKPPSSGPTVQPQNPVQTGSRYPSDPRPVAVMDKNAVSVFAREQRKSEQQAKARNFSRPRSVHSTSFDDRGGIPGKLPRPTSLIIFDAPPVPSLPVIEQPKQVAGTEGQVTRPQKPHRPSSMFADAPAQYSVSSEASRNICGSGQATSDRSPSDIAQLQISKGSGIAKPNFVTGTGNVQSVLQPHTQNKRPVLGPRSSTSIAPEQRNKKLPEPPRISDAEALEVSQDWEMAKRAWKERRKFLTEGLQLASDSIPVGHKPEAEVQSPLKTRSRDAEVVAPVKQAVAETKSSDFSEKRSRSQLTTPSPRATSSINPYIPNSCLASDSSRPAREYSQRPMSESRVVPRTESLAHIPFHHGSDTFQPAREDVPRTKSADVSKPRAHSRSARPVPRTESLARISNYRSEPAREHAPRSRSVDPPSSKLPAEELLNRYGGGLAFNYEPGLGLGGSAGQRNLKSKASRKSIDISMSYGVDLSDIPVFVNF